MPKSDWGNTIEFAMKVLLKHWEQEHDGIPGIGEDRPINCMTCRGLASRVDRAYTGVRIGRLTLPYDDVVKLAMAHALTKT